MKLTNNHYIPAGGERLSESVSKPVKKVETGEWVVKWMVDGKRDEDKTYYTDDEKDAWDTYRYMTMVHLFGEDFGVPPR